MHQMNRIKVVSSYILICFVTTYALATSSFAQSGGEVFKGIGNNDEPIQIEAEEVEIVNDVYRATLKVNVVVTQGDTVLQAKKVEIFYLPENQRKQTSTGIREIIASGAVAIKSGENHATGDKLEINFLTETAILSGKEIILSQGLNAVKGCELTVELTTGNSEFGGCRTIFVASPKTSKN